MTKHVNTSLVYYKVTSRSKYVVRWPHQTLYCDFMKGLSLVSCFRFQTEVSLMFHTSVNNVRRLGVRMEPHVPSFSCDRNRLCQDRPRVIDGIFMRVADSLKRVYDGTCLKALPCVSELPALSSSGVANGCCPFWVTHCLSDDQSVFNMSESLWAHVISSHA